MPKQDDYKQDAGIILPRRQSMRAAKAYLLAPAERWLRPADQLDYAIRRWVIPIPLESSRPAAATPILRRSMARAPSPSRAPMTGMRTRYSSYRMRKAPSRPSDFARMTLPA